jgi:type 1 fimbria pilin
MAQNSGGSGYPSPNNFVFVFLFLTLGAFHARVNAECRFNSLQTHSIGDFTSSKPTINAVSAVSSPTKISSLYSLNQSPELVSECKPGNDGANIYSFTQAGLVIGNIDGKALFKTNITGIAYTLAYKTLDNSATAFFSSNTTGWKTILDVSNESLLKTKTWQAAIEFYQLPSFTGIPANVTSVGPAGGTIGKITIGDPNAAGILDHPKINVTIASMAFFAPIQQPTCNLTVPKTVNLGEYNISDVESNNTQDISVAITGNCSSTRKVTIKLTTSKTTGSSNSLLANTASQNAAKGVGAALKWPNNNKIVPNSGTFSYTSPNGSTIALFSQMLTAQLVKSDTEKVTSGQFSAIGTLQFTYE